MFPSKQAYGEWIAAVYGRRLWARHDGCLRGIISQHQGWVRIFGWGVIWKSDLVGVRLYSERVGQRYRWRIGPWKFQLLRPMEVEG